MTIVMSATARGQRILQIRRSALVGAARARQELL
eukprot:CAMPEP_0171244902 /NCGR_PEP_ID=MMETSP0790-20130122/47116_1 /TAXON_ID=2925 /ORGANISM="Alexandrium catenella, Strain OF101" /LENGTH=33 /DNA_ID= /DNA_START= /DNA_END= /DNA_ORIENTATION=